MIHSCLFGKYHGTFACVKLILILHKKLLLLGDVFISYICICQVHLLSVANHVSLFSLLVSFAFYLSTVYFAAYYRLDVLYNIRYFISNFWEKMLQPRRISIYIGEKDHSIASLVNSSKQGLQCDLEVNIHAIE